MDLQSIAQIITGLQLMFLWVGESIIEAGELGGMVPLGLANFAVRRALIRPLNTDSPRVYIRHYR